MKVSLTTVRRPVIILSFNPHRQEVLTMKRRAFVDAINNAWTRLTFGEMDEEEMEVHLGTLYQFIKSEIREDDFLEITFASDQKTIIVARKLVEETHKRKK
jgi:hypothetical protein